MSRTDAGDGTVRRVLDNGLTVIAQPRRQAPIGSFWIWYRVGGRNEVAGITGISHWVEHMLFKGTQRYGKGEIFRTITACGGSLNGFTWVDYTAYYETLPVDRIDVAFDIEADRLAKPRFDPDEVAGERTVIISERQGSENQPGFLLTEEISAAAFKAHPYGHLVIGHRSDLEAMTREDLYGHYQSYYQPNNAVAVFVGDLEADEAVARIEAAFGAIPRGPEPPAVRSVEPEQYGERRVTVRRPAPNRVLNISHRSIPAAHPDVAPLVVLDAVLSGGKPMSFGGGAALGRSSRLYRSLVTAGHAAGAGSSFALSIDPYLFGISATLRPEAEAERVEGIVLEEIEQLASEAVPEDELARVKKQIRAQFTYSQQSVSSRAYLLGALAMVAPERTPAGFIDDILAVNGEDVRRVAASYLTETRRTTGWLIPTEPSGGSQAVAAPALAQPAGYTPDADDLGLDRSMPAGVQTRLANGLRVLTLDRPAADLDGPVVLRVRLPGGVALDDGKPGVARFTAELLTRGSDGRTLDDIAEELDGLGASITAGVGREISEIVATALREDLDRVLELLAAAVLRPDFPAEQVEIVRGQILSGLRQVRQDTRAEAEHRLRGLLYPPGHPYQVRVSGDEESVAALTADDMRVFHARAWKPSDGIVAVGGGLAHEEAVALVERHLGHWTGEAPALVVPPPIAVEPGQVTADLPGKVQADIAMGSLAIDRQDPDFYALNVGNLILGRLGLMGRIGESVRERQGMAYYAFSTLDIGRGVGFWSARAGVNPDNIERATSSVIEEVRGFLADGPTEREYSDAIGHLTGALPLGLETVGSVSSLLADIAFFDLGLDYLQRYRGIIAALTPAMLVEALRRYVDPDHLAVVVVKPGPG